MSDSDGYPIEALDAAGISVDCALKAIRGMVGLNLVGMEVVEVTPAKAGAK
jgi:arginase family enzyme